MTGPVAEETASKATLHHKAGLVAGDPHPGQDRPLDGRGSVGSGKLQKRKGHLTGQVPEEIVQGLVIE